MDLITRQRRQAIEVLKASKKRLLDDIAAIDKAIDILEGTLRDPDSKNSDGYYVGDKFVKIERDDDDPSWAG